MRGIANDESGVAYSLRNIADMYVLSGDHERARALHVEAHAICVEIGDVDASLARSLAAIAHFDAVAGRAERAARIAGAAFVLCGPNGPVGALGTWERIERCLSIAEERLGAEAALEARAEGAALSLEDVLALAEAALEPQR